MSPDQTRSKVFDGASSCPVPDVLLAFHRNRLSSSARKNILRHLRRCPSCAQDSRFIADALRDESRLIQGLEALLLPESKKSPAPKGTRFRRISMLRIPGFVAAIAAVGIILTFFMIPVPKRTSLIAPEKSTGADLSGPASGASLAARLFPKRCDAGDQLKRAGVRLEAVFDMPPYVPNNVLGSFKISAKRDRDDKFHGWSLALYSGVDGPHLAIIPR